MNKYDNGKIYKVIDNINGNIYYGSTTQTLHKRLIQHKSKYLKYLENFESWRSVNQIIMSDNYKIELCENYPCKSNDELTNRENYYIEHFENINLLRANKKNANRKLAREYYHKNKEYVKKRGNKYYYDNKKYIQERSQKIEKCNYCKILISHANLLRHQKEACKLCPFSKKYIIT